MITQITLKPGRRPGSGPQTVKVAPLTVFVGPNNSGKTKVISELLQALHQGVNPNSLAILGGVSFESYSLEEAATRLSDLPRDTDHVLIGRFGAQTVRMGYLDLLNSVARGFGTSFQQYVGVRTLNIPAGDRTSFVNQQPLGNLAAAPTNAFARLFTDDRLRKQLRDVVYEAIGEYVVFDHVTQPGLLLIRFSESEPPSDLVEKSLLPESVEFIRKTTPIDAKSEGVKSFVGILIQLVAGNPSIFVIDEPETFLHPSLARTLGTRITETANRAGNRVFAATHSADFLMGCIQAGAQTTIVRLTYARGAATARVLAADELLPLMRKPMLRSSRVLTGLFYDGVIVTEGDPDRAFYEEVTFRMSSGENALFVNAQNWQTIHEIIHPLRALGIPAAAVVDVDVLMSGDTNWKSLLAAAEVPDIDRHGVSQTRALIEQRFRSMGISSPKKSGGINVLSGGDREAADNLCDQLEAYGIFVVRHGELENWLEYLGVKSRKEVWLSRMFERMGSDPNDPNYVRPQTDRDVWAFVGRVMRWIHDPNRKGIPA